MHLYGALCVLSLLLLSPLSRALISPWPHANHDSGHSNAASESVPSFYRYCAEPKELLEASSVIIPRPGLQLFISETDPAYAPNNNISVTLIDMKTGSTTNFTFSGFAFLGIDPVGELRLYAWSSTMQGLVVSTLYAAFSLVDGSALWQTNITGDYPTEPRQLVNSYTDTIDVFVPSRAAPKTFATFRIAGRTGAQVWQAVATLNSSSAVAHVRPVAALPSGDVVVRAYTGDAAVAELAGVDGRTGTFKWVSDAFGLSSYVSQEDVTVLLADGAYVVYWIGAEIVALDSATGALLWRNATVLPADTQPAVASVRAFGRTMLALQSSSSVFVVDPLTGHKHATYSHLNPLGGYTLYSVRGSIFATTYNEGFITQWDVESGRMERYGAAPGARLAVDADGTLYAYYDGTFPNVAFRQCPGTRTRSGALIVLGLVGGFAIASVAAVAVALLRRSRQTAEYSEL